MALCGNEWHQTAGTECRMQVMVMVDVSTYSTDAAAGTFLFSLLSSLFPLPPLSLSFSFSLLSPSPLHLSRNWRLRPHQVIPDLAGTKEVKRNIRHSNRPVISQSLTHSLSFSLSFFLLQSTGPTGISKLILPLPCVYVP